MEERGCLKLERLTEVQDQHRRTLAQEEGMVLSPEEYLKSKYFESSVGDDRTQSVHDVLNGAVGKNLVQSRTWLRVSRSASTCK